MASRANLTRDYPRALLNSKKSYFLIVFDDFSICFFIVFDDFFEF